MGVAFFRLLVMVVAAAACALCLMRDRAQGQRVKSGRTRACTVRLSGGSEAPEGLRMVFRCWWRGDIFCTHVPDLSDACVPAEASGADDVRLRGDQTGHIFEKVEGVFEKCWGVWAGLISRNERAVSAAYSIGFPMRCAGWRGPTGPSSTPRSSRAPPREPLRIRAVI
jgi:hypothetical protein